MEWFEPLIAACAIFLVILPIILKFRAKKKGKSVCSCGSDCASCNKDCLSHFKAYVKSEEFKCACHDIAKDSK